MRLTGLQIADDPQRWRSVGFALDDDGRGVVGGVRLEVAPGPEPGIAGWSLAGARPGAIDGLRTTAADESADEDSTHPNTAVALDHVVLSTPDLDRTMAALQDAGLLPRRIRRPDPEQPLRQAFYVLGTALAEVVGPSGNAGPARFWGLTFSVADLDGAAARLGERLGSVRAAVQAGRRIATVTGDAGLAVPVAFMTPRPPG